MSSNSCQLARAPTQNWKSCQAAVSTKSISRLMTSSRQSERCSSPNRVAEQKHEPSEAAHKTSCYHEAMYEARAQCEACMATEIANDGSRSSEEVLGKEIQ
ncbi:hypothetical protein B9Z55_003730 [Caenorhabditis nigoni]|uniref:Uncharacterized protein n=1 Tax=Caenorhabditis nigoni TaxID=1611254 RepID=A0A2G5VRT4_9PELO|nr:hypothetical protein B9Z55_004442 [Caenorhabditis nigoni]PIC54503.1 hypothetical protein B9Z55_003730 [Caenorhabditis nigoni]